MLRGHKGRKILHYMRRKLYRNSNQFSNTIQKSYA